MIEYLFQFNTWICFIWTMTTFGYLFHVVKTDHVPITYYVNLLISNLVLIGTMISFMFITVSIASSVFIDFATTTSLIFRVCLALERCFLITSPQWQRIRQTKASVLLSVGVWIFCGVTVPLTMLSGSGLLLPIFWLFPAPIFIICLAWTIKALPAATTVQAEEKRRTLAILVLLLLHHSLTMLPIAIHGIAQHISYPSFAHLELVLVLFLLGPYVDLIVIVFFRKNPVNNMLLCLGCSKIDNNVQEHGDQTTSV